MNQLMIDHGLAQNLGCPFEDDFMLYRFKIEKCVVHSLSPHIWRNCPFVHPGEPVQRRHPSLHLPNLCPNVKQGQVCPEGPDKCGWAHNSFEAWLHPERYKTILCRKGAACSRSICFFAHTEAEVRRPTKPEPTAATGAAAAAAAAGAAAVTGDSNSTAGPPGLQLPVSLAAAAIPAGMATVVCAPQLVHASPVAFALPAVPAAAPLGGPSLQAPPGLLHNRSSSSSAILYRAISNAASESSTSSSGLAGAAAALPPAVSSGAASAAMNTVPILRYFSLGAEQQQILQGLHPAAPTLGSHRSSSSNSSGGQQQLVVNRLPSPSPDFSLAGFSSGAEAAGMPAGIGPSFLETSAADAGAVAQQSLVQLPPGWSVVAPGAATAAAHQTGSLQHQQLQQQQPMHLMQQQPIQLMQQPNRVLEAAVVGDGRAGQQQQGLLLQQMLVQTQELQGQLHQLQLQAPVQPLPGAAVAASTGQVAPTVTPINATGATVNPGLGYEGLEGFSLSHGFPSLAAAQQQQVSVAAPVAAACVAMLAPSLASGRAAEMLTQQQILQQQQVLQQQHGGTAAVCSGMHFLQSG